MTSEVSQALEKAETLSEIDDIYRPFRPKRKTRASVAKAKGLQPLADCILEQNPQINPEQEALAYLSEELEVTSAEEALQGANDIIAELISDDASIRKRLRVVTMEHACEGTEQLRKTMYKEGRKSYGTYKSSYGRSRRRNGRSVEGVFLLRLHG